MALRAWFVLVAKSLSVDLVFVFRIVLGAVRKHMVASTSPALQRVLVGLCSIGTLGSCCSTPLQALLVMFQTTASGFM